MPKRKEYGQNRSSPSAICLHLKKSIKVPLKNFQTHFTDQILVTWWHLSERDKKMYIFSLFRACVVFSVLFYGYACSIFLTSPWEEILKIICLQSLARCWQPSICFPESEAIYIHRVVYSLSPAELVWLLPLDVCKGSFSLFLRVSLGSWGVGE